MNLFKSIFVAILTFQLGHMALAKDANDVQFTDAEVQAHLQNVDTLVKTAAQCLDDTYAEHIQFFNRHGVSKFYGDRKSAHKTREGRIGELRRFGAPTSLINELEPISCIGLTMKCLEKGFLATGQASAWGKIKKQMVPDMYGTDLQIMLRNLGWQIFYWNPDPSSNARWDAEDKALNPLKPGKKWNPVWGGHEYRYSLVLRKEMYYTVPVDNYTDLVGFDDVQPKGFDQVPFFVGTAHAGYHVFPGRYGDVIEAHSTRSLDSIDNLEFSEFNPLGRGGGPRWTKTEKYRSGVIAVPPIR